MRGDPFACADSLLQQAEEILAGPPVPVNDRRLADVIEMIKVRCRVERDEGCLPCGEEELLYGDSVLPLLGLARLVPSDSPVCHTPLIMPGGNNVNVTFDSAWTLRCSLAPPDSRYEVSGLTAGSFISHLNFFGFTFQGRHAYGFCLDHTKQMPAGSYNNISMEEAMPGRPQTVRIAVSFCIANAPVEPSDYAGGQEFFDMLGLNTCPGLNGYDAYGVIQATIWCLLGYGDPSGIRFLIDPNCPEPSAAPKFPCLDAAVDALYNMAYDFAYGNLDCGEGGLPGGAVNSSSSSVCGNCGCANCAPSSCPEPGSAQSDRCNNPGGLRMGNQLGDVFCCNTGAANTDQTNTYLTFVGCANDLRECCGRVLLGPFKLAASNRGTPTITLVPCDGCQGADITLTDYCCNTLETPPVIGQEFYITFRPPCCKYCFDLCAEMLTTAIAVYYFKRPNTNALQPIGAPLEFSEYRRACIHICIDITPPPPPLPPLPEPEPWLLVNNNNNNNNNDNNSNLMNSLLENLLSSLLANQGGPFGALPGPGAPFPGGPCTGGPFPCTPGAPYPGGPCTGGPFPCWPFPGPEGYFPWPCGPVTCWPACEPAPCWPTCGSAPCWPACWPWPETPDCSSLGANSFGACFPSSCCPCPPPCCGGPPPYPFCPPSPACDCPPCPYPLYPMSPSTCFLSPDWLAWQGASYPQDPMPQPGPQPPPPPGPSFPPSDLPPLLPEFSSAPRAVPPAQAERTEQEYDQFYRDWYGI